MNPAILFGSELLRQAVALMSQDELEAGNLLDTLTSHAATVSDLAAALSLVMSAQSAS